MKKIYIVSFFLFASYLAHAGKSEGDSLSSKWSIGVIGALDFFKYDFQNSENGSLIDHYYEKRQNHYSAGVVLTRKVSSKFTLRTGFFYGEKGFNRVTNPDYYAQEQRYIKEIRFYTYYLQVPIFIKYNILEKGHWSLGVSTGTIINIPIRRKEHYVSVLGKERDKTITDWDWNWEKNQPHSDWEYFTSNPPGKCHASWALSPLVACRLEKIEFSFEPIYQYYFANIYKYRLTKNAKSYSAMLGINYWF